MSKILMGPQTLIYPMPVLLVGVNVDGKPNFMAVSWSGIASGQPPMISVSIRKNRYSFKGLRENLTFSVNLPSVDMVKEADYCGIAAGSKVDKVSVCGFDVFYGKLDSAPLIEQCPVNLECTVVHLLDLGSHSLVIGRIEETHVSESCITDGKPDVNKVNPFVFITTPFVHYQNLGRVIGKAFSIGKALEMGQ